MTATATTGETRRMVPPSMAGRRTEGPAPIDLVHLARQTFGSAELEREVLGLFVQQGGGLVGQIRAGDPVTRRAMVHRLKGSARGVGATRVAHLCEALETTPAGAEVTRLIDELEAAVGEVAGFVADLLGPRR